MSLTCRLIVGWDGNDEFFTAGRGRRSRWSGKNNGKMYGTYLGKANQCPDGTSACPFVFHSRAGE
jgi:hypothetical protein